ncbi:MAG: alpha/beta hydrolase [Reichenbachiella sp.]
MSLLYFFVKNDAPILKGDVKYGIPFNKEQTLDIYFPTSQLDEFSPVIVFIHGGAWIAGRKESINLNRFNGCINALREQGYTVITPSYTLARKGKSPFPQSIIDVFESLNWIKENANLYNFDVNNIGVFGESAGAHLAMLVSYAKPSAFNLNLDYIPIRYVVDVYGPSHLESLYMSQTTDSLKSVLYKLPEGLREFADISEVLIGFDPKKYPQKASDIMNLYSPLNYLEKDLSPTLIIHGDADIVVPIDQSLLLKNGLDKFSIENQLHIVTQSNHGFIGATDVQKDSIQQWIAEFIIEHHAY